MSANHLHQRRIANDGRSLARKKVSAAAACHVKSVVLAASAALLLCACAGTPDFLAAHTEQQAVTHTAYVSTAPAKHRRMRVTSRDILLEWTTFGIDPLPRKHKRVASASPLNDMLDEPDYILTIEQIMANAACNACEEKPYHQMVLNASSQYGVPASLIHAVIQKESGYNPGARSVKHARGLMQITPETARFVGVHNSKRLYDPQTNINAGTAYLKYLIANHATVDEALAAYNSGPGNVRKYKGVPPFRETRRYVRDVKKLYKVTVK
ncbi:lytic transglycosylase domain-containing protein [Herbaspirillum sp. ST 5-3]|uniref:lytic transglycosylase domain-containing protein n=1 Tax=Oxalobacteraceae TaxID=75682 RepID=UPI0010A2FF92|nr:lytic transglycosylase domain-containing protein [Herbaspirillum sp. ST 5-3]